MTFRVAAQGAVQKHRHTNTILDSLPTETQGPVRAELQRFGVR